MTTQTMTKEQIVKRELNGEEIEFFGDNMGNLFDCMEIYKDQQLSAEREAHKKEIERILSAVARGENLADSLNFDGKSELQKERERAGKLVEGINNCIKYLVDKEGMDDGNTIVEMMKQLLD